MGNPISDPMNPAPPARLQTRVVYAEPGKVATFRLTGDRKRAESARWFASTRHPVRSGNEVKYLVDGATTFAEMAAAIRTAKTPGHFVYMLGWTMFVDCPMLPGVTLGQLFRQASDRGAQVRAMVWQGWGASIEPDTSPWQSLPGPMDLGGFGSQSLPIKIRTANVVNSATVAFINDLKNGQAVLDGRHLDLGAHHQKILVVNGEDGLIAFVGGVDVNPDRIFPLGTNGSLTEGAPMHDVHCRLRGPVTKDVLQTFIDRWADFTAWDGTKEKAPLAGLGVVGATPPERGKAHVQLALTFGNTTAHAGTSPPYRFAPTGETTIMSMFLTAIAAAKQFIYIEDQYLVAPQASAALLSALDKIQQLVILIPHSSISDLPHVWELRKKFIEPLIRMHSAKVKVCVRSPFGPAIPHSYVHAKTWIFDDRFAIIGSANCNQRGWTHDSESCVGIFEESSDSAPTYTFAHRLRIRLWAEHLGMDTPEGHALLADGPGNAWRWSMGKGVTRYDPDSGKDTHARDRAPMSAADPDGR